MSIVCYGEILVRLSPSGGRLFGQASSLDLHFGGAEANVAVSLARLGVPVRMISVLTENELGQAARMALRGYGVDVAGVISGEGEMGLYFAEPAAGLRPVNVVYQRAASAFVRAPIEAIDWRGALAGATWLHLSGVSPALGEQPTKAALRAAYAARDAGVPISFDGNYRSKLWSAWRSDGGGPILRELFGLTTLAFANERDLGLALDESFTDAPQAAAAAFAAFPSLQHIASTTRTVHAPHPAELGAYLIDRDGIVSAPARSLGPVIDRIGAGDAFAAGVLYGLGKQLPKQDIVSFALAAACLKHGQHGDFNMATESDVRALMDGETTDVRR